MIIITKRGSSPITITPEIRSSIESFKKRLKEMAEQPDETSAFDARTIDIILNKLDDYDRNIICAYYSIADSSPSKMAKCLGVASSVLTNRISRIKKQIQKLNDIPKSAYNLPRECIDY